MKMLDMEKLKRVKVMGLVVGAVLLLLIGYGVGASGKNISSNPSSKENKTTTIKSGKTKELTQKQVKNFLISYYTKKDLSENRNRYKEYMTDAMYNQEVSIEDEATNQAYKGYVVDYIFKEAEIYIDTKNKVAIAKVRYTNLLSKKNNYEKAQKNVSNESTLRLTYVQQNNKLLVNKKESILLVSNTESNSDYPDYGTATSSNDTTESSDKTK